MNATIGVIGIGYVGNAVAQVYREQGHTVLTVDTILYKSNSDYTGIKQSDAIFICVPSPSRPDGTCNTTYLDEVLLKLQDFPNLIISKTTAPPDYYDKAGQQYPNLIHVPEFLTAKTSYYDYKNETSAIIGGTSFEKINQAWKILQLGQTKLTAAYDCSLKEAAFAKYVENSFLATKVIFMNEMAELAQAVNIKWNNISHLLQKDKRIGLSHTQVPGPDGQYGFGGACFPKDTEAFLYFAEQHGINLELLKLSCTKNLKYRKNYE